MKERFRLPVFEIPNFLLESSEQPKIQAGGSSNSNMFNRYFQRLQGDVNLLQTRTNLVAARCARMELIANNQGSALLSAFQSVSTRVDIASGYSHVLADMFSQFYVNTGQSSAAIDYRFGQATLPVRSTTNLLVEEDPYGNKYVSPVVDLSWATGSSVSPLQYVSDPEAINMLKGEQAWMLAPVASGDVVWTKISAPMQYRNLAPNVLELYPMPHFAFDLLEVAYQLEGQSFSSTWTALDLSYLPGWQASTSTVSQVGPVRLHLPNVGMSQLRIKMRARTDTPWGWYAINLYHREYSDSATLTVQDPYSRTITSTQLRGKDPSLLSLLTTTLNSNNATVQLTTTSTISTPVITGVIMAV